jgi:phosphopantothenoylcysteine decarboxylase/phosphopantothenate--cysteine ligase
MNDRMWAHAQVQHNVSAARGLGYHVLQPATGALAAGEGSGPGRMPEPEQIFAHIGRLLEPPGAMRGRRVVVTAGPTREAIDPVRFISNRSSGRMGVEIASAAWRRGAAVTLVAGPLDVPAPEGPKLVRVESTREMRDAVNDALPTADVLVMAAAPADFSAAAPAAHKVKKANAPMSLALAPTDDILMTTRDVRPSHCVVVGFALETRDVLSEGRRKRRDKGMDFVVVNDATEAGAGFGGDTNRVTIIGPDDHEDSLPLMPKRDVADAILDRIEALLHGR